MGKCILAFGCGMRHLACRLTLSLKTSGQGESARKMLWMYLRTMEWMGRPRAANALRFGSLKTAWCGCIIERFLKPFSAVKISRSRTCSPTAIAGLGAGPCEWVMMPRGRFAREKWLPAGIENQDFKAIFALSLCARKSQRSAKVVGVGLKCAVNLGHELHQ